VLASIRPDDWELPLFLHVLGAMTLVGALVLVVTSLVAAWRGGTVSAVRAGYRALLIGAIPSWVVMRFAGEWIADKEKVNDIDPTPSWVDIGYMVGDTSLLLLVAATVLAGIAARRMATRQEAGGSTQVRIAAVLVGILIVADVVAIWAMTTKPT
jgi:hypothetical protein